MVDIRRNVRTLLLSDEHPLPRAKRKTRQTLSIRDMDSSNPGRRLGW